MVSGERDSLFHSLEYGSGDFLQATRRVGLAGHFESIYAGVIDKRDRIGEILDTHQLDRSTTAFVGDMAHDLQTAKHGGVDSVAVATGYDPVDRLTANDPTHLFDHLSDFREWLEGSA